MSRTTRLFDLMQVLRRHRKPVSGKTLAQELGVSLRTLYRDIADLKAIGAHIDGEPGLGYVLSPGFMLPPLMFSAEEVEALALGLKWVERRADHELASAATDVLAKVGAVLPPELSYKLEDSSLIVGSGFVRPLSVELTQLRRAIREECKISIRYRDRSGSHSARTIWPFALGYFESMRMLAAWCELRQDYRQFRLDRIESATLLGEHYPRRRHDLRKEWLASLGPEVRSSADLLPEQPSRLSSEKLVTENKASVAPIARKTLLPQSVSIRDYDLSVVNNNMEKRMEQEIILYTHPYSRGGIVLWMLEELGVPYRLEYLEYGQSMKGPEYLAINPMGKVPAIRHGDVIVTEAAAICAYLADQFPEAGLAPALNLRADYYRWLFFAAGPFEAAAGLSLCKVELNPEQEMQLGCGRLDTVVDTLAGAVRGRQYIAGDRFSAADIYVGSHIGWGMQFGTLEKRPEFVGYWDGLKNRPAHLRTEQMIEKALTKHAWAGI